MSLGPAKHEGSAHCAAWGMKNSTTFNLRLPRAEKWTIFASALGLPRCGKVPARGHERKFYMFYVNELFGMTKANKAIPYHRIYTTYMY